MIGIVECGQHVALIRAGPVEPSRLCQCPRHRVIVKIGRLSRRLCAQPILVDGQDVERFAMRAEGVEIAVVQLSPIDELDAQFERTESCLHKFAFVYAEHLVERADRRNSCFANAHRADFFGFNQDDFAVFGERIGERRSSHPASGAAADDQDRAY